MDPAIVLAVDGDDVEKMGQMEAGRLRREGEGDAVGGRAREGSRRGWR